MEWVGWAAAWVAAWQVGGVGRGMMVVLGVVCRRVWCLLHSMKLTLRCRPRSKGGGREGGMGGDRGEGVRCSGHRRRCTVRSIGWKEGEGRDKERSEGSGGGEGKM